MFNKILLAAAITITSCAPSYAQESSRCMPRDTLTEILTDTYGESAIGSGIVRGGNYFMEIFGSPSGSWTTFLTDTDGLSCVVATGNNFQIYGPPPVINNDQES